MFSILHISDTHGEGETSIRIDKLVWENPNVDVIASTGDTFIHKKWNDWPQKYKLSVIGNHEKDKVPYDDLGNWITQDPWMKVVEDFVFFGFSLEKEYKNSPFFRFIEKKEIPDNIKGFVILSHEKISLKILERNLEHLIDPEQGVILHLHGHEHSEEFEVSEWEYDKETIAGCPYYRSKVYSAARYKRGLVNKIVWENNSFSCEPVRWAGYY